MTPFVSILSERPPTGVDGERPREPDFLRDLNLDQVIEAITAGRGEYDLTPFFHQPAPDVPTIHYRHAVCRDLQQAEIATAVRTFADSMRTMRKQLDQSAERRYRYQKHAWFVDAVDTYCAAVRVLAETLAGLDILSAGLRAFRDFLHAYRESARFTTLVDDTRALREHLSAVRYCVLVRGSRVTVTRYADEADYSSTVEATFAKFRQGAVKDYRVAFTDYADLNHVEEQILGLVAKLYPDVFAELDDYRARHHDYLDTTIGRFDREVQFYLAYLGHLDRLTAAGLPMCYPDVRPGTTDIAAREAFDIALASKLVGSTESTVVCNDFALSSPERILVVTGPNQGGKTTFARMVGQLHYLASLGLPVSARDARLALPDRIFTHFEREESLDTLRGKLDDELVRMRAMLDHATHDSVVIMNESFSSTTLSDAVFLGTEMLTRLTAIGAICVCVTFVDELASLSPATVSLVATVDPADAAIRTYNIVRKPADGLAYAAAIATKYGLTYHALRKRVAR